MGLLVYEVRGVPNYNKHPPVFMRFRDLEAHQGRSFLLTNKVGD